MRINHASADPRYRDHPGLQLYGIESYIAVPLRRRDGSYFGTLCALDPRPTDLTDQAFDIFHLLAQLVAHELEADERHRRREAHIRALEEVVAMAAHDLRTPLTAARAAFRLVEVSAARRLRADERALLETGRRNAERLDRLIDDLLAYNQLEAGMLRLAPEPLDLRDVVAAARPAVEPLLRDKGQPLAVHLPEALPTRGDRHRLEQVVINLLANAHRHTAAGTAIAIAGRALAGEVRLVVRDRGAGIRPEEQEAIFRRFHRGAPRGGAPGEAAGGTGLGLAIAKGLVELHAGRIWVESAPGAGAAFHVALPRAAARRDAPEAAP